jgi:hypothetical protein
MPALPQHATATGRQHSQRLWAIAMREQCGASRRPDKQTPAINNAGSRIRARLISLNCA